MKYLAFVCIAALWITGCAETQVTRIYKPEKHKLTANNLFNEDYIYDVIFDAEEFDVDSLKNLSKKKFLKGIDLYKNKKNPRAAIPLFEKAILIFPDAKIYFEMGNAYLDLFQINEAEKSFAIAERLNFEPSGALNFKMAAISSFRYTFSMNNADLNTAYWETMNAISQNYLDSAALLTSPHFANLRSYPKFDRIMKSIRLKYAKAEGSDKFTLFYMSFPSQSQISNSKENPEMSNYDESISFEFADFIPEMENTAFSRDVSNDYFYVGSVMQTPAYSAVIYKSISFWGESWTPSYITLATYDPKGVQISRKIIGCNCSATKIKTFEISGNSISVSEYKREWEKPLTEVSMDENKVSGYEKTGEAGYTIHEDGIIETSELSGNFKDSVLTSVKK